MFSFKFEFPDEASRVLEESPWVLKHYMLTLQRRKPYLCDNEIQLNTCPFSIQLYNIPPTGNMIENYILFASQVGNVVAMGSLDDARVAAKAYARARIEFNVERPLVNSVLMPRPGKLSAVRVKIKYEKLARFCFTCGRLGHESRNCEEEEERDDGEGAFDSSLCAAPVKGGRTVLVMVGIEGPEENYYVHGELGKIECISEALDNSGRKSRWVQGEWEC